MSRPVYEVVVTRIYEDSVQGGTAKTSTSEITFRVDELHQIAPKLAAFYPVPAIKRSHRRKGIEGTGFEVKA